MLGGYEHLSTSGDLLNAAIKSRYQNRYKKAI
jgi:hypothetical protein